MSPRIPVRREIPTPDEPFEPPEFFPDRPDREAPLPPGVRPLPYDRPLPETETHAAVERLLAA